MGAMTLLITGAAGHVGRAAVSAARVRGHRVRALTRREGLSPWAEDKGITPVCADLMSGDLAPALSGVDAVIHAAAAITGDEDQMHRDTVQATEALMRAVADAGVRRVVLVSSLSVYGTGALTEGALVDEATPLERQPNLRDAYCRAKLAQEIVALDSARASGIDLSILRAGAVWGPGRLWNAHLGLAIGPVLLRLGTSGQIPLIHRETCAQALVHAAEASETGIDVINLVDTDLPDRTRYINALQRGGWPRLVLPLSWRLLDGAAGLLSPVAPRLPGLLRRPVLRARLMPLAYSNARMQERLGPFPQRSFEDMMAAAQGARP